MRVTQIKRPWPAKIRRGDNRDPSVEINDRPSDRYACTYYYLGITVTGRPGKIANDLAAFLRLRFSDETTTIRKSIGDFTTEIGIDSKA